MCTSFEKEVHKLYSKKEKISLNLEITEDIFLILSNKLYYVMLSADDYDIKESELPNRSSAVIREEKKAVGTWLEDVESKLNI